MMIVMMELAAPLAQMNVTVVRKISSLINSQNSYLVFKFTMEEHIFKFEIYSNALTNYVSLLLDVSISSTCFLYKSTRTTHLVPNKSLPSPCCWIEPPFFCLHWFSDKILLKNLFPSNIAEFPHVGLMLKTKFSPTLLDRQLLIFTPLKFFNYFMNILGALYVFWRKSTGKNISFKDLNFSHSEWLTKMCRNNSGSSKHFRMNKLCSI